jgi:zinc protease
MNVVGSLDQAKITGSLKKLESQWKSKSVEIPEYKTPAPPSKSQVYFYDVPDAKQSVIRIGYPALAQNDQDFYPAIIMNYILGGGGFAPA